MRSISAPSCSSCSRSRSPPPASRISSAGPSAASVLPLFAAETIELVRYSDFREDEMSTIDERRSRASAGLDGGHDWGQGFAAPRVVLQPIAAPSILGLFG